MFATKIFIVQQADDDGRLNPVPVAVKFTFTAAHKIAKRFAPAKVTALLADKNDIPNGPGQLGYQGSVHLIAQKDLAS